MRVKIVREGVDDPVREVLADLCERVVPFLCTARELSGVDADVLLTLGGVDACHRWDVVPEALGFHAVMSDRRHDDTGSGDDDDEEDDDGAYYEVNERHEAVVNLDAFEGAVGDFGDLSDDREIEVESWLVTVAHELLHVAEWVNETGGDTPDEVYQAGSGPFGIRRTYEAIEARLAPLGGSGEDHIESVARRITLTIPRSWISDAVTRLEDAMSRQHVAGP